MARPDVPDPEIQGSGTEIVNERTTEIDFWDDEPILAVAPMEREALITLMTRGTWPYDCLIPFARKRELAHSVLHDLRGAAAALDEGQPPPLRILLNSRGLESHKNTTPSTFRDLLFRLSIFSNADPYVRTSVLLDVVRLTAANLSKGSPDLGRWDERDPHPLKALEAECAGRILSRVPPGSDTHRELTDLVARYRIWRAGDPRPWSELEMLGASDLKVPTSVVREDTKKLRQRRIDSAAQYVFNKWLDTLANASG